ncbi:unnamed protein product [Allacma fusca]|uniref:Uncharacterized protein n=1 Tax=Allacma fusca TaxID=39272 RepID=A0A8J2LYM2_9HEXA|nr:unnamed protein product [Allacma fusca]
MSSKSDLWWTAPSWSNGFRNIKPTSVVQTLFLTEINSSDQNRRFYDLDALAVRQLHKGRAWNQPLAPGSEAMKMTREISVGKKRKCPFPGDMTIGRRKYNCPHFSLATTASSGPLLGLLDEKIYFRRNGKDSSEVAFAEMDYEDFRSPLKIQFCARTDSLGKFGNDCDVYYPPLNSYDTVMTKNRDCHPSLLVLEKSGRAVQALSLDTGAVENRLGFGEDFECRTVIPRIWKALRSVPTHFKVSGAFLVGFCSSSRINLYDLEETLLLSRLKLNNNLTTGDLYPVTHKIEKFPRPLLSVSCYNSYLDFYPLMLAGFYIVRLANFYNEVRELNFEDDPDRRVHFLPNAPPRVISVGRNKLKVFEICEERLCSPEIPMESRTLGRKWFLKLIFDLNFGPKPEIDQVVTGSRKSARVIPRMYHDFCANNTLVYGPNEFLQQITIVKFETKRISCYVYDMENFQLQYEMTPKHFAPDSSDVGRCQLL